MSGTLRIAHVNPSFHPAAFYGGPTESGLQTVRHLAQLGHDVRVLTTDADGPVRRTRVATGIEMEIEPRLRVRYCARWLPESVAPGVLAQIGELVEWSDVVHLTGVYNFTTFPTLLARLAKRRPLVWSPRGGLLRWPGGRRNAVKGVWDRLAWALLSGPCAVHTTSEREAEGTRRRLPGVPVFVVPNGVVIPQRPSHEPASGPLRITFLGRLDPIKGIEQLIDALAICDFEWRLTVAGAASSVAYGRSLRDRATPLGSRIQFIGKVDALERDQLFARSDLVVVPSHSENFGLAIAEALAYGVPVIASTGTPWQRLEPEGCGAWVSNDPYQLASAIQRMAGAPLREMGARGRAWMSAEYGWDAVAKSLVSHYRALLHGSVGSE